MAVAKLNAAQAATIRLARQSATDSDRKAIKREVFAAVKAAYGIPNDHKLRADVDANSDNFAILVNSKTGERYELGTDNKWTGATATAANLVWMRVPSGDVRTMLRDHILDEDKDADDAETPPDDLVFLASDTAIDKNGNGWVQVSTDDLAD